MLVITPLLKAQGVNDANTGGSQEFHLQPNGTSERWMTYENDPDNIHEHNQLPLDRYHITRLVPGKQYTIRVERVNGSIGSFLTVFNRETGRQDELTTFYEEKITATKSSHGPVDIVLLRGLTSYFFGFVTIVYKISVIPSDLLERNDIIRGANELFPDGTLIKTPTNPTVYLIENGQKRGFPSRYHFESWFMGRWDLIVLISDTAMGRYPNGNIMPFRDGTLLKYSDRPSDKTVFVIAGGQRKAFRSWEDFIGMGYSAQNIKAVPGQILDAVPRGPDLVRQILIAGGAIAPSPTVHSISGRVTDNNGNGLEGVAVSYDAVSSTSTLALDRVITDSNGNYMITNVRSDLNYFLTPSKQRHFFSPRSKVIKNISSDQSAYFVGASSPSGAPRILTQEDSERAAALDSVTKLRDPLALRTVHNFSVDAITRVSIFATDLTPPSTPNYWDAGVSVIAEDANGIGCFPTIEQIASVPSHPWITQFVLQIPMKPSTRGDIWLRINYRGAISNRAFITLNPSIPRRPTFFP
jgi:hypothetical protein